MGVTLIVSAFVLSALLYGRLAGGAVILVVAALVFLFWRAGRRHSHQNFLQIDALALGSRMNGWNTGYKVCVFTGLLVFVLAANSLFLAVLVGAGVSALTLWSARLPLGGYFALLTVPATFVLLSGTAMLFDVSPRPLGYLDLPFFSAYLSLTRQAQDRTALVMVKALAALCCLYALALSTPVFEITSFLRRMRLPAILVELMVLIYRYIFVLVSCLHSMSAAARSRLGYSGFASSMRSFKGMGATLLSRSFGRASRSFSAMESRCYDGEIRFLEPEKALLAWQPAAAVAVGLVLCGLLAAERRLF